MQFVDADARSSRVSARQELQRPAQRCVREAANALTRRCTTPCDMEWDTPLEAEACGETHSVRRVVSGRLPSLIAGEGTVPAAWPQAGIVRLDAEMTWHDAADSASGVVAVMVAVTPRGSWLHRSEPLRLWARETRSNWFWGLLLPGLALAAAWWTGGLSLLLLLGYPALAWRVYRGRRRRGDSRKAAALYARYCVLGKFAHAVGQFRYHRHRLLAQPSPLIEYKRAATPPAGDVP